MDTSSSGYRNNKLSHGKFIFATVLIIALHLICDVQCQFFTKANSKSIPRMGRRSAPEAGNKMDVYRRMLIDRLVDEFGPDLLGQLRPEVSRSHP